MQSNMGKKDRNTPLRLPRKLKKDIIKVAGRDSFYRVIYIMTLQYVNTGNQYIKIKRGNG